MNKEPEKDDEGMPTSDALNFSKLALRCPDVNARDNEGVTAVMMAAREGNWHMIPGLVLSGASLNMKDMDQYTALHWACHEGETDCVAVLLDCKANLNDVDSAGWTPLMLAVHVGCNEAAQLLIDSDAKLLQTNNEGGTAYDLAHEGAIYQLEEGIEDGHFRALVDMLCDGLRDVDALTGKGKSFWEVFLVKKFFWGVFLIFLVWGRVSQLTSHFSSPYSQVSPKLRPETVFPLKDLTFSPC